MLLYVFKKYFFSNKHVGFENAFISNGHVMLEKACKVKHVVVNMITRRNLVTWRETSCLLQKVESKTIEGVTVASHYMSLNHTAQTTTSQRNIGGV